MSLEDLGRMLMIGTGNNMIMHFGAFKFDCIEIGLILYLLG